MYRKDVGERSPRRLLDRTIHGGLGSGGLGVVLARAGVGKTAFLVQLGLDDLLRGRSVLHVGIDTTIDRVRTWYDELLADLRRCSELEDPAEAKLLVERHRMIQVYTADSFSVERLLSVAAILRDHAGFVPSAILLDGLDWNALDRSDGVMLKGLAAGAGAELWATALTHRHVAGEEPQDLPPPCDRFDDLIDVAVFLAPRGDRVDLRLLRDHDSRDPGPTTLELEPVSLRLSDTSVARIAVSAPKPDPGACTLHTRGTEGAEVLFGEMAERHGLAEVTWSAQGHDPRRRRGLVVLEAADLERGETSLTFVARRLGQGPGEGGERLGRKLLWHQVQGSKQVFVVGAVQPDGTVGGPAGWAAELARSWDKQLWIWDTKGLAWKRWVAEARAWQPAEAPCITAPSFCGTGDPQIGPEARHAVEGLFERSFGSA